MKNKYLEILNPSVPRRFLLLIAALVWTMAGGILLFKAYIFMDFTQKYSIIYVFLSVIGGLLFYYFMFSKISGKHIKRIVQFKNKRYCAFAFFNERSYILMGSMISMGIILRKFHLVNIGILAYVYLTMGIPLTLSSFRFYYAGIIRFRLPDEDVSVMN